MSTGLVNSNGYNELLNTFDTRGCSWLSMHKRLSPGHSHTTYADMFFDALNRIPEYIRNGKLVAHVSVDTVENYVKRLFEEEDTLEWFIQFDDSFDGDAMVYSGDVPYSVVLLYNTVIEALTLK